MEEISKTGEMMGGPALTQEERSEVARIINDLEKPITKIVGELRDDIDTGGIGLVLGHDSSGRIPTLLMGDIIQELSPTKPDVKFITPMRVGPGEMVYDFPGEDSMDWTQKEKDEKIKEYLSGLSTDLNGKKVLLVTEYTELGSSLKDIIKIFEELGMDYEIACAYIPSGDTDEDALSLVYKGLPENAQKRFHFGERKEADKFSPELYRHPMRGVRKIPKSIHSEKIHPVIEEENKQKEIVRLSRLIVPEVSQRIIVNVQNSGM